MSLVIDSHSESNGTFNENLAFDGRSLAQMFTGNDSVLDKAVFYLSKTIVVSITGTLVAKVYSVSGTNPTAVPVGTALATSDSVNITSISTSLSLVDFIFSGSEKITIENSTNYFIAIEFSGSVGASGFDKINVRGDDNVTDSTGNGATNFSGSWVANGFSDYCYYVYGTQSTPTAVVSPVATTLSIPSVIPVWVFQATASVSPVSSTLSVVDPTATYVYEQIASVSPLTTNLSLPEVVATHVVVLIASVLPEELSLVLPTVSATYKEYIADVSPISTSFSIPEVTPIPVFSGFVSPLTISVYLSEVSATYRNDWKTFGAIETSWASTDDPSTTWDSESSLETTWAES